MGCQVFSSLGFLEPLLGSYKSYFPGIMSLIFFLSVLEHRFGDMSVLYSRFILFQYPLRGLQFNIRRGSGRFRERPVRYETKRSLFLHLRQSFSRSSWIDSSGVVIFSWKTGRSVSREYFSRLTFLQTECLAAFNLYRSDADNRKFSRDRCWYFLRGVHPGHPLPLDKLQGKWFAIHSYFKLVARSNQWMGKKIE